MKMLAFLFTGTAALALSACGGANDSAADDTADTTVVVPDEVPAPTVTETAIVRDTDGADSSDPDSVTVGPDGVKVDIDSNGTRVQADSDSGSVTVSE
jgi:hypothetical protein